MLHQWPAQARVYHDVSVAEALPGEISTAARIALVTTRSLVKSRIAESVREALGARLVAESAAMRAHSPVEDVLALAALLRESRAELVVCLGGGSVIDGAKVACLAVWRGITDGPSLIAAAVSRGASAGAWDGAAPSPRLVAVPTTLSAAEFAPAAGYTDVVEGRKYRALDPWMVPRAVLLDPAATLETPAELFLSSGIRALDHAAERWCALEPAPFSDAVSRQAMLMLAEGLPRCIHRRIPSHHRMQHEAGGDAMRHAARGTQNIAKPMAGTDGHARPSALHGKPGRLLAKRARPQIPRRFRHARQALGQHQHGLA